MKRDLELIREILLSAESAPAGKTITGFNIENKSEAEVLEHVDLLVEGGLLDGQIRTGCKNQPNGCIIRKLTWEGHDFLANARNEKVWRKVMASIGATASSVSIEVLKALLSKAALDGI